MDYDIIPLAIEPLAVIAGDSMRLIFTKSIYDMALGVLSYPVLSKADYRRIWEFRKENDELYFSVAEPHFAFVFSVFNIDRETFIAEIKGKAKGFRPFEFEIKCAMVNKDAFLDCFHILLVPDKGYSSIVKLHDKLYSGILFKEQRLDIDFIPHIGIGNSPDKYTVKSWVDQWNGREFSIKGEIITLTIVDYIDGILSDIVEIKLV